MRAMVHSHIAPCEPCDQIGTNIQLDTKLDQTKEIINFKRVRHQSFWNQWQLKLRESLAHLVGFIMRRAGGDASVALRVSFV